MVVVGVFLLPSVIFILLFDHESKGDGMRRRGRAKLSKKKTKVRKNFLRNRRLFSSWTDLKVKSLISSKGYNEG